MCVFVCASRFVSLLLLYSLSFSLTPGFPLHLFIFIWLVPAGSPAFAQTQSRPAASDGVVRRDAALEPVCTRLLDPVISNQKNNREKHFLFNYLIQRECFDFY